jgi:phosphoribosylanthranilate isomerase
MLVKASAINNLSDARFFAAQYSVEWMGFCLDEGSASYMPTHLIKAMKEWIEGPKIIGEMGLCDEATLLEKVSELDLSAVQLPMFSPIDVAKINAQIPVIQEIVVEQDMSAAALQQQVASYSGKVAMLLLDFEKNAWTFSSLIRAQEISIELLQRICQQHKVIISINANAKQWQALIQSIQPSAISLKGGEEERVGYKSFDELNEIFDTIA